MPLSAGSARVIPVTPTPDAEDLDDLEKTADNAVATLDDKDPEAGDKGSGDEEDDDDEFAVADDDPELDVETDDEWNTNPKKALLKCELLEYCENTTVHGFTYIPNGRNTCEKVFWVVVVLIGFTCGSVLVHFAFKDWRENPTMTATETYSHPVTSVQYPTITICPIQEYSNWNFARLLLNGRKFVCKSDMPWCQKQLAFWQALVSDQTPSEDEKLTFGYRDELTTHKPFKDHILFDKLYEENFYTSNDITTLASDKYNMPKEYLTEGTKKGFNFPSLADGVALTDAELDTVIADSRSYITRCLTEDSCAPAGASNEDAFMRCWNMTDNYCSEAQQARLQEAAVNVFLVKLLHTNYGSMLEHFFQYVLQANLVGDDSLSFKSQLATDFHREVNEYFDEVATAILGVGPGISLVELPSILMNVNVRGFTQDDKNEEANNRLRSAYYTLTNYYADEHGTPPNTADFAGDTFQGIVKDTIDGLVLAPLLGKDLDKLMQYMRFSQLIGDPETEKDLFEGKFGSIVDMQNNLKLPIQDSGNYSWDHMAEGRHRLSMLIKCESALAFGEGFTEDMCFEGFKHTITNIGICSTFNSKKFDDAFIPDAKNDYLKLFRSNYKPPAPEKVFKTQGSGQAFTMLITLDSRKKEIYGTKKSTFSVNVNNEHNFFSVGMEGFEAIQGYRTVVSITPIEHTADEALETLDIDRRKCRYSHENPTKGSIFRYYTQKACRFECALTESHETVKCTPWNYPMTNKVVGEMKVCDGTSTQYFEGNMTRNDFLSKCQCLPDCSQVAFNQEMDSLLLRPDKECATDEMMAKTNADLDRDPADKIFWKFNGMRNNNTFAWGPYERCLYKVQHDYAMLTMEIATPRIIKTKKQLRFSFVDQLGTLGGGIGLFTGLSLISLVEAVFWVGRISWSMATFDPEASKADRREKRKERLKEERKAKAEEEKEALEKGDDDDIEKGKDDGKSNPEDDGKKDSGDEKKDDDDDDDDEDDGVEDIEHENH